MIDLKSLVGKRCIIQFKDGNQWLAVSHMGKDLTVVAVDTKEGKVPILSPFLLGEIVETSMEGGFAIDTLDTQRNKIRISLNDEAILTATHVLEMAPEPSRIIT